MKVSAVVIPAHTRPRSRSEDPVLRPLQDRYERLPAPLEEAAVWCAGVTAVVTFGSMALHFAPVVSVLGPIGTPLLSTVSMFGFAYGALRMQNREKERKALENAMSARHDELECQRNEVEQLLRPGRAGVDETPRSITIGAIRVDKRQDAGVPKPKRVACD